MTDAVKLTHVECLALTRRAYSRTDRAEDAQRALRIFVAGRDLNRGMKSGNELSATAALW